MSKIDTKSGDIELLHKRIQPIISLLGGTEAMRDAGEKYLPKFKSEEISGAKGYDAYKNRLKVSTLVPYFEDTIRSMVGRVFHKPFIYDLPALMAKYENDIDLRGNSISEVFESAFFEALSYSKSYIVVDYSMTGSVNTLAEEISSGARPHAFKVDVTDVLDVREEGGVITLFKYQRKVVDEDNTDDFEVVYIDEVVLMKPGVTTTYRLSDDGGYTVHESYEIKIKGKPLDYVSVVELKLSRKPPLQNLADLNIKHWQSQSSQDNIVNTARVPILKMIGLGTNFKYDTVFVSGGLNLPVGADAEYVEHSGAAIAAGQTSLDKLEEQMSVAGAKLITKSKMALTDTQAKGEKEKEVSELMLYGLLLNSFMNKVLSYFGAWLDVDQDEFIDITDNLQNTVLTEGAAIEVIQAMINGIISVETAFDTLQAKGAIMTNRTFSEEQEQIAIEKESGVSRSASIFDGIQD